MDKVAMQRLLDRARELAERALSELEGGRGGARRRGFTNPVRNLSYAPSVIEMLDLRCEDAQKKGQ